MTEPEWTEALLRAGFDGLHVSLRDDTEGIHMNSLLVSHAQYSADPPSRKANVSTVIVTKIKAHEGLPSRLQASLSSRSNGPCDIVHADLLSEAGMVYD